MNGTLSRWVAPLLKLPSSPPEPPPGASSASRVFRAAEAFVGYRLLAVFLTAAVVVAPCGLVSAASAALGRTPLAVAFGLITALTAVLFALWAAVVRLDWELRYYVVTDAALRIREGAWTMRELTLTFLNVQNVAIDQGPLERLFGISNVVVQTAGGSGGAAEEGVSVSGHRAVIRGVADAAVIRDLIRARLEAARRDSGLGDLDDQSPGSSGRLLEPGRPLALLQEIRAETQRLARAIAADGQ